MAQVAHERVDVVERRRSAALAVLGRHWNPAAPGHQSVRWLGLIGAHSNGPTITEIHKFGRDTATGVPLVPSNVLRQLGQDDRLVITNNKPPAHAYALDRIPRSWRHLTRPAEP